MSTAKPTYVSSSGTLASQPITSRIRNWTGDYVTLVYLFFETLITNLSQIPPQDPRLWVPVAALVAVLAAVEEEEEEEEEGVEVLLVVTVEVEEVEAVDGEVIVEVVS
ncbi:MAG: hypothetical protein TREMPRED_003376 [Tremellales sp. Tagirdzhanova-0007]|nr:MAG: hypothetical protein TREMPRED_003376 [Tremellales sp. Tagirdzhanova-0007]